MQSKRILPVITFFLVILALVACGNTASDAPAGAELTEVILMLDWVPNTNHTGFYVAQEKGYFEEAGLSVQIIEPGEVYAEQAVAGGIADFGISFQEYVTLGRITENVPVVSIAAIIQHNTSGFASPVGAGVETPADWEGLRYGSFGTQFEGPTLESLMACAGGDAAQVEVVDTGFVDPLALLESDQIDLAWIFYGWQGIQAEQQGLELDVVMMSDYFDCIPDYYTPLIITGEETIATRPEVVSAFLEAVSRGYEDAIADPAEAADILLKAVPELDEELVRGSQAWLAGFYQADAARWGEQQRSVWEAYARWMLDNGIVGEMLDVDAAFTNEFLP